MKSYTNYNKSKR